MASHRRRGVLVRALRLRHSPSRAVIPVPRQRSIELVDGRTRVTHRVSPDALAAGRQRGDYVTLCGAQLLPASLTDPGPGPGPGVRVMNEPQAEIDAICEVHQRSGRLVVRREGDRIVLDGHADECCVIVLEGAAVTLLFDVLGELV